MKIKLILGLVATLSLGVCGSSAQTTKREKPPMPPLPPGLIATADGKIKEDPAALAALKNRKTKGAALIANNPAPGTQIDEAAGAALPKKRTANVPAPK